MTVIIGAVIALIIGSLATARTIPRDRFAKARTAFLLGAATVTITVAIAGVYLRLHEEAQYASCIQTVERSGGNRQQWLDISSYLDVHGLADAATYLDGHLDLNLPALTTARCDSLKP